MGEIIYSTKTVKPLNIKGLSLLNKQNIRICNLLNAVYIVFKVILSTTTKVHIPSQTANMFDGKTLNMV